MNLPKDDSPALHAANVRDLLTAGRCMAPLNPKPVVTTSFCVYPSGHGGPHSWQDTAEDRRDRMKQEGWT